MRGARQGVAGEEEAPSPSKLSKEAKALQDRLKNISAMKMSGAGITEKTKKSRGDRDRPTTKDKTDKKESKAKKDSKEAKSKSDGKYSVESTTERKRREMEVKQREAKAALENEKQLIDEINQVEEYKEKKASAPERAAVMASLGIDEDEAFTASPGRKAISSGVDATKAKTPTSAVRGKVPLNLLKRIDKVTKDHLPPTLKQPMNSAPAKADEINISDLSDLEGGRARRQRGQFQVLGHDDDEEVYTSSSDEDAGVVKKQPLQAGLAAKMGRKINKKLRNTISNLSSSRFEDWSRHALVMVLVHRGVELRGEAAIATQTLIDMADEAFFGESIPEKPRNFTIWELLKLSWAVSKVQDVWIEKIYRRRMERMRTQDFFDGGDEEDMPESTAFMYAGGNKSGDEADVESGLMTEKDHDYVNGSGSLLRREDGSENMHLNKMNQTRSEAIEQQMQKARPLSMITNAMKVPWVGPNWDKARVHADYVNPRKGGKGGKPFSFYETTTGRHCCLSGVGEQCDIFREGQTSEVGIYGSGVANYFKFIKWIAGLMLALCLVTLPLVTLNYFGRAYDFEGAKDWRDLSRASLGNLLPEVYLNGTDNLKSMESYYVNGTSIIKIQVPVCKQTEQFSALFDGPDPDLECVLDKEGVGKFYMWIDFIVVFVVFVAYLWLKYFEDAAVKKLDSFSVFASMYTVQMKNLPKNCTQSDIKEYVVDLLGDKPKNAIASVNMAYDNAEEIKNCTLRGDYVRQKIRMTSEFRYHVHLLRKKANGEEVNDPAVNFDMSSFEEEEEEEEKKKRKAVSASDAKTAKKNTKEKIKSSAMKRAASRQIKALESDFRKQVEEVDRKIGSLENSLKNMASASDSPLVAYVTFNSVSGSENIMKSATRQHWRHWLMNGCKDTNKKIMGKAPHVKRAPEPSTILWENLKYTKVERFFRRAFITFAAFCVIGISLAFTLTAKYLQDSAAGSAERSTACPSNWDGLSEAVKQNLIGGNVGLTHCYCDEIPYYRRRNNEMCTTYFDESLRQALVTLAAASVVVFINAGLGGLMGRYSFFEKHHTEDARMKSAFDRIFILKYINTSLVFLVNNNKSVLGIFKRWGYIAQTVPEFSREWYDTVGVTILMVQVGNIFGGHVMKSLQATLLRFKRWRARHNPTYAISQDELNKLHEGPQFRFAENYAQLMSTFYSCMTFNLGIPLLNWIVMVNFLAFYFIDKYFFVNICCSPAKLNVKLNRRARSLIPGAIFIHLAMAVWTLCTEDIFLSDWDQEAINASELQIKILNYDWVAYYISDELYQSHVFPIVLLMTCAVAFKLLLILDKYLKKIGFWRVVKDFLRCGDTTSDEDSGGGSSILMKEKKKKRICGIGGGGVSSLVSKLIADVDDSATLNIARAVTYPRAVQRNLIKGLATYNILHNPVYKEKFAITWKFAMRHHRVRSVLLYDTSAGSTYDEAQKDADALRAERMRRVSALPIIDKREAQLRAQRELKNKKMLDLVQGETRRRAEGVSGGMLSIDEEGKDEDANNQRRERAREARTPPPPPIITSGGGGLEATQLRRPASNGAGPKGFKR
jgi:hypothetical protein